MEREIVTFGSYFNDFLDTLPEKVIEKIDYISCFYVQKNVSPKNL